MVDLQQADLNVGKIYDLIKQHKDGINLRAIAAEYPPRDATVPYVIAQLLADNRIKTEQRGDGVYCMAVHEFEQYLQQYKVDPVRLSGVANVRYTVVYNAQKGKPITPKNAQKIKEAALKLVGTAYTGPFVLAQPTPNNQPSTFPVKKPHKL